MTLTGWQVEPGAVRVVLDGVDAGERPIAEALTELGDQLEAAASSTGSAAAVAAVRSFARARQGDIELIRKRVPSARQAVSDAVNAVEAGDEEMAATTQAAAASAWGSDASVAGVSR